MCCCHADQSDHREAGVLEQRVDGRARSTVLPQLAQGPAQNTRALSAIDTSK